MSDRMDACLTWLVCLVCLAAVILFYSGCALRQDRSVDFYVDAVMYKEFQQNDLAIEKLNSAIKENKKFSLAYSLLGDIYQDMKEYEKSANSYEMAAELNPWSFKDYFSLGKVYELMEKFTNAVKAYKQAVEIKPDNFEANLGVARNAYQINDYNDALVYGRKAEEINPDAVEVQKILGEIYETQKDYEQAIRAYKRALELDSNDVNSMMSLAVAYLKTGRNEPAKELLTIVIQRRPESSDAFQYLGYCYLRLNDIDNSIASYSTAIEINGKDWQSYRGLGVAYMLKAINTGDETLKTKAIEQWRMSLDIMPDQPRSERLRKLVARYEQQK